MRRNSKKGFTLAELLIVIAIIAILIAIMFPVFGAQLNKARAAAELANVRAKYSELVADAMLGADYNLEDAAADGVEIELSDLEAACTYQGTTNVTYENNTITVEYNSYTGSFAIDEDVTVNTP